MPNLVYLTSLPAELERAQGLLAEATLAGRWFALGRSGGSDPCDLARFRVLAAHRRLAQPCFIIESALLVTVGGADCKEEWSYPADLGARRFCQRFGGFKGVMRHVLAYTADGQSAELVSRDSPGEVSSEPRGGRTSPLSDRIWLPNGFGQTFAELGSVGSIINRRVLLLVELAHLLGLRTADDLYEAHVTVNCDREDTYASFRAVCGRLHVKAIHIELAAGDHPSHLITASFHRGSLEKTITEVNSLADALRSAGFSVTRAKVEAMIRNSLVPTDDASAESGAISNYFEFHVKIALGVGESMAKLQLLCNAYGAHLSRNPSNSLVGDVAFYFATLRVYKRGRTSASDYFNCFLAELRANGFKLSNILREFTVYDTNEALDDGWFPSHRGAICSAACELLQTMECPMTR